MEETLGKRIVSHRKRLGLTQEQLAEQLGITAQAVSKWEHDLSFPDITILPRLAEIFGTTTDALLGIDAVPLREAEIIIPEKEEASNGLHIQTGPLDIQFGGVRKISIALAVLVLLVGGLLLAGSILEWPVSFWGLLWPSALLVFGLWGLYPRFGFFRLGCAAFGAFFLANELRLLPGILGKEIVFPAVLVLFGLSLLAHALRRRRPHIHHLGPDRFSSSFQLLEDGFICEASFGSDRRTVDLPRLTRGNIECCFGELIVDLSGCTAAAADCTITADCSFGNITILLPRRFRAEIDSDTSFGIVDVAGQPDPDAAVIRLICDVSFGSVDLRYI